MKKTGNRLRTMVIILCVLTIIVLCFPWWFTQNKFSILDLSQTGQIGDTIGGILSPFIAILVGYLTFEAFRMQYEANKLQIQDINNQKLSIQRERFDNRFYNMLDTLRNNSREVKLGDWEGKEAFKVLVEDFFLIYYWVKGAYISIKPGLPSEIKSAIDEKPKKEEEIMLTRMAYGLFFYGKLYNVDKDEEPHFFKVLDKVKTRIEVEYGEKEYEKGYFLNHEIKRQSLPKFSADLYIGHNSQLGHYYRHLYQMVVFLASSDVRVVSENDKNEYARIIRGELSDFEQVLLFYSAVSDRGQSWNTKVNETTLNIYSSRGLLSRFRLIKNIPGNIIYRGISPWDYYKAEEKWWKSQGKDFFEQRYILMADDEY